MKIIPNCKDKEKLIDLWVKVFGDEREFAELIFLSENTSCDIFADFDDENLCSALYLLDCNLSFENRNYTGKYLYAAATAPDYRGRGIMASLINEAVDFCKRNGVDFISLVPADDGLYNYYRKFGFEEAMHRKTIYTSADLFSDDAKEIEAYEYFRERDRRLDNCFSFNDKSQNYAVSVLSCSGMKFYANKNGLLFIRDSDGAYFNEVLFDEYAASYVIDDNFNVEKTEMDKYGMLYPIHAALKIDWRYTDIYMNIALD